MSDLFAFFQIGFRHIVSWDAADHILFLLVLAAIYRGRDWRAALVVISAFTVGHCITLVLAVTNVLVLPARLVEFLIPMTIVATGVENLLIRRRVTRGETSRHRPVFAALFGLVHGAGFAGYLQSLFLDRITLPLLGFNIGIEVGQIVVLCGAAAAFLMVDRLLQTVRRASWPDAFQLRLTMVSAAVTIVSGGWAIERYPR